MRQKSNHSSDWINLIDFPTSPGWNVIPRFFLRLNRIATFQIPISRNKTSASLSELLQSTRTTTIANADWYYIVSVSHVRVIDLNSKFEDNWSPMPKLQTN